MVSDGLTINGEGGEMDPCLMGEHGSDLREKRREREIAARINKLTAGRNVSRANLQQHIKADFAVVVAPFPFNKKNVLLLTDLTQDCRGIDLDLARLIREGKKAEIIKGTDFDKCKKSACPHGQDCSVAVA